MKHKPKDKAKSVSMMGGKPFAKSAKKPEPDDKPHMKAGPSSVNKNTGKAKRAKRLAGVML